MCAGASQGRTVTWVEGTLTSLSYGGEMEMFRNRYLTCGGPCGMTASCDPTSLAWPPEQGVPFDRTRHRSRVAKATTRMPASRNQAKTGRGSGFPWGGEGLRQPALKGRRDLSNSRGHLSKDHYPYPHKETDSPKVTVGGQEGEIQT